MSEFISQIVTINGKKYFTEQDDPNVNGCTGCVFNINNSECHVNTDDIGIDCTDGFMYKEYIEPEKGKKKLLIL